MTTITSLPHEPDSLYRVLAPVIEAYQERSDKSATDVLAELMLVAASFLASMSEEEDLENNISATTDLLANLTREASAEVKLRGI